MTIRRSVLAVVAVACVCVLSVHGVTITDVSFNDGGVFHQWTMTNNKGMSVTVMDFGATLVSVKVPDKDGKPADVMAGFAQPKSYLNQSNFASTVGRYANRIAKGELHIGDATYHLTINNAPNALHGGPNGFWSKTWTATLETGTKYARITFSYTSPDGEENYPGTVHCNSSFELADDKNELILHFTATTDKPTVVGMTNHGYWNLAGHNSGELVTTKHILQINADLYVPVDETLIPTGELLKVSDTPYLDFTQSKIIGRDIKAAADVPGVQGGYDNCYVVRRKYENQMVEAAKLYHPDSGRVMTISTTAPGIQFYSCNFWEDAAFGLTGSQPIAKDGAHYVKYGALALETEFFPDSPNHAQFPSATLLPGMTYDHKTVHAFTVCQTDCLPATPAPEPAEESGLKKGDKTAIVMAVFSGVVLFVFLIYWCCCGVSARGTAANVVTVGGGSPKAAEAHSPSVAPVPLASPSVVTVPLAANPVP